jgi:hypothetical protein
MKVLIDRIKARLHRDIVADPVLHGMVLNLYLNGEQYPHRVSDYFPFAAVEEPELERRMRAHVADEDKHIALYTRAIEKLDQPVTVQPLGEIFNGVIRRHTPASFTLQAGDNRDTRRTKLAHFFAHLHFLEKRVARSLEYHFDACAHAASDYPQKVVGAVLGDEGRHVRYTHEVVGDLLPARVAAGVLELHARAEQRANLDFSAGQLRRLVREYPARFPALRGRIYGACAALLRGVLAIA